MKIFLTIILLTLGAGLLAFSSFSNNNTPATVLQTVEYFKRQSRQFAEETANLKNAINQISSKDSSSIRYAKEALKKCRLQYKSIEFFLTYFLSSTSVIYNQPNKVEVEERDMESYEPVGLQVIETMLFEKDAVNRKTALLEQADLIHSSASDMHALLYNLKIDEKQIIESIRLELIRILSLGITGFDTPELKTGIAESAQAFKSMETVLASFLSEKSREGDSIKKYLALAVRQLEANSDFDSFDRLRFLTNAALPLQDHLGVFIAQKKWQLATGNGIDYAKNLFSTNGLSLVNKKEGNPALARLGQRLFFEKRLSGNLTRSCATCHLPEKYFTDQRPKSLALDGVSSVERNAPSLFYAAYQFSQFWDGRARNLEEQIKAVLANEKEMAADHGVVVKRLGNTKPYSEWFKKAFEQDSVITIDHVAVAIAAFLKTLAPLNSPFDRYVSGDRNALTKQQIRGFNLFMGKAQCGTCHFAPLFNGLVPPLYNRTEVEVLGVPKNTDFTRPVADDDIGRYTTVPVVSYRGAFKTPTVRNIAKTAPYMHNGAFATLEQVLEFYNKGGGVGLGLNIPEQTLSPKPLKLDSTEIRHIILFLHSLTDTYTLPSDK